MTFLYILFGIQLLLMLLITAELMSTKKELNDLKNLIKGYMDNNQQKRF